MARRTFGLDLTAVTWTADSGTDALSLARGVTGITVWDSRTGGTQITSLQDLSSNPVTSVSSDSNGVIGFKGPDTTPPTVSLWLEAPDQPVRQQITASDLPAATALKADLPLNVRDYGAKGDGTTDDAPAIQAALNAALAADGGWVWVPPGTYKVATLPLRIYHNTRLTVDPQATIARYAATTMVLNGDAGQTLGVYTGHGSITIEGGVWDMRGATETNYDVCFSIGHCENITIRDLTVKDTPGFHGIELNSTKVGRVDNCRFIGFYHTGDRGFSEAVQIDLAKASGYFGGFGPYDHTPCRDIVVSRCYFGASGTGSTQAWPRAFGSHAATKTVWHRDVKFIGNECDALPSYAVGGYNWERATVANNTFNDCGAGIRMRSIDSADTEDTKDTSGTQTSASQEMGVIAITGNTFSGITGADDAILIYGETTGHVTRVAITGNVISTVTGGENGIRLQYVDNYTVAGNVVRDTDGTGISMVSITGGVISGNRVAAVDGSGIASDTGTDIVIAGNGITEAGSNGVHVIGGTNVVVNGNQIKGASRASNGTSYGIRVSTSATYLTIANNRYRKFGSGNEAGWALGITNTCTNIKRYGNDFRDSGAVTAVVDDQSTTGSKVAEDGGQQGVVTLTFGTSPQTSAVSFATAFDAAPLITGTLERGTAASTSTFAAVVESVATSGFTVRAIRVAGSDTGTVIFHWRASER